MDIGVTFYGVDKSGRGLYFLKIRSLEFGRVCPVRYTFMWERRFMKFKGGNTKEVFVSLLNRPTKN